jgi:hypothetical protein
MTGAAYATVAALAVALIVAAVRVWWVLSEPRREYEQLVRDDKARVEKLNRIGGIR